jgi:transcriptional regulator with XRE-family HTH domain
MEENSGMLFNFRLIREMRQRDSISQADLANLLGISETYLCLLEKGTKRPSLRLIQKIVRITGVPIEKLLQAETEEAEHGIEMHSSVSTQVALRNKVESERRKCLKAERRSLELERKIAHLEAIIGLHIRFEEITCQKLTESEKMKKLKNLARTVNKENELSFYEILAVLKVGRSILKSWLHVGKYVYRCKFAEGGAITASMPGEAGLRLRCFDCGDFESKECKGYGNEKRPENIIELIARLEVNGVHNRADHLVILEECYNLPLSLHELSETIYRDKHGLHIPEGIYYMDNAGRRRETA